MGTSLGYIDNPSKEGWTASIVTLIISSDTAVFLYFRIACHGIHGHIILGSFSDQHLIVTKYIRNKESRHI